VNLARSSDQILGEKFMNRGGTMADATDEFDVQEVLDMLEVAARARKSYPSLAPVGLDVDQVEAEDDSTPEAHLVRRRRNLSRYVIGAVTVACAILLASFVKRSIPADDSAVATQRASARPSPVTVRDSRPLPTPIPASPVASEATAGLLRFEAPPGWAWLDGQQLSGSSAFVPCGTHHVQIGGEEQRDVVVPCGGEVVVSR
jgi:hypothetical protein